MAPRLLLACVTTTMLILAACSNGNAPEVANERSPSLVEPVVVALDCSAPIAVDATVPKSYDALADAVALPTSVSADTALQVSPSEESSAFGFGLFAKTGLLVRAGAVVELAIPDEWQDRAGIWWGNSGGRRPAGVFEVGPCTKGVGWLAYPGGFHVDAPSCVPLLIRDDKAEHLVHVAVGAPCPDQEA